LQGLHRCQGPGGIIL